MSRLLHMAAAQRVCLLLWRSHYADWYHDAGGSRMAVIHIDPVPFRCSPGEVLTFVAGRGKLDGKQVGKIAFVGRGATVEVPDAKAAAIVAALDGATFRDKPVRVRFAGKADFTERRPLRPTSPNCSISKAVRNRKKPADARRPRRARRSATARRSRGSNSATRSSASAVGFCSPSDERTAPTRCRRRDSNPARRSC